MYGRELEMRIYPVISVLALFCLAAPAFAQQDIDKKKVLEELEMPKADIILSCTISTEGELKEPEYYWPAKKKIESLKTKLSALDPETPSAERAMLYDRLGAILGKSTKEEGEKYRKLAVREYELLLQKDKDNPELLLQLSCVYSSLDELEKAWDILVKLVKARPDFYKVYAELVSFNFLKAGEKSRFEEWSKKGEEYFSRESGKGRTDAEFYVEYGRFHFTVQFVRFLMKSAEKKQAASKEDFIEGMKRYFEVFASEKGFSIVRKALELDPKNRLCHIWLGAMHLTEVCVVLFRKMLEEQKEGASDEDTLDLVIKCAADARSSKNEEVTAAEKHLLAAYENKAVSYVNLWENMVFLQMVKGDWAKYEHYLLEAIRNHPGHKSFYSTLLGFYVKAYDNKANDRDAKVKTVIRLLEERNKVCPDAELHFICGKARYELGDSAGVLKEFDKALKVSPGNYGANLGKIVLLAKEGKSKKAFELMEKTRNRWKPKNQKDAIHANITIAILCMLQDKHDIARHLLDRVIEAVPENEKARKLRGMLAD
jgi:tetratricopeptide (TPR) repeat protein